MAIENFTTYDETDEGSNVTIIASKVSWNDLARTHTSHVSDSKGAGHFSGDFEHKFEFQFSDRVNDPIAVPWALANAQLNSKALADAGADAAFFWQYRDGLRVRLLENGAFNDSLVFVGVDGTLYFVTIKRDDDGGVNNTGQLTAEIHTGDYHPAGTHVDLLTVDASAGEQNDFEYIFGLMTYDDNSGGNTIDGFTQNLDLQEVAPPVGMAGAMTTNTGYWGW